MSPKLQEAVELLTEISDRANAMGISLVAYPVPEVREVIAGLRRAQMQPVPATSDGADLEAAREALEPFAAIADLYDGAEDDDFEVWKDIGSMRSIRTVSELRHFRRARAALRRRREDETGSKIGGGE